MTARVTDAQIAEARAVDVPELIGRYVQLRRSAGKLVGCCPFHDEQTGSFTVYDDHAHCFGCGWHGGAILFLMAIEKLSFPVAVERLAPASNTLHAAGSPRRGIGPRGADRPTLFGRPRSTLGLCAGENWARAIAAYYRLPMLAVEAPEQMREITVPAWAEDVLVFCRVCWELPAAEAAVTNIESQGRRSSIEKIGGDAWPKSRSSHNDASIHSELPAR
jgi:hypothetical protein